MFLSGCNSKIVQVGHIPELKYGMNINQLKKDHIIASKGNKHIIAKLEYKGNKLIGQQAFLLTTNNKEEIVQIDPYKKPLNLPKLKINRPVLHSKDSLFKRVFSDIAIITPF